MSQDATLPSPGDVIAGKYRVERLIGRGGMGAVFAAQHLILNQRVALKLLLGELADSQEASARFVNEARAAAQIQGEHVARVLDIGQLPTGVPFMVLEYLEGSDLAGILQQRGPLPVSEVADYALQALDALAQAHSAGIVHRDLKPANLFLTSRHDGTSLVKVLDFGISKNTTAPSGMTSTRAVMGSPEYMSPEQLRTPRGVDARTDIWSLGVILYELLAGRVPFQAETLADLFMQICQVDPPSIRTLRPDVPPAFEAVVMRCMAREPSARFQSVRELSTALLVFASDQARAMAIARGSKPGLAAATLHQEPVPASTTPNTAAPGDDGQVGGRGPLARRADRGGQRPRAPRGHHGGHARRAHGHEAPGRAHERSAGRERRVGDGRPHRRGRRGVERRGRRVAAADRHDAQVARCGDAAESGSPDAQAVGVGRRHAAAEPAGSRARAAGQQVQPELLLRQRRQQALQTGMLLMKSQTLARGTACLLASCAVLGASTAAFADPTARECAAASEDALSLRKQERLKDAKERLLVCSTPSCPAEVRDECARRMTDLTAAQPTVVFDVKDAQGGDLLAVRVSLDGALLVDHLGGGAVTVDPGEHTFRFESSGQTIERKFVIRESEKGRTISIAFGGGTPAAGAAPAATPIADQPAATPPPADSSSSWNGQKTAAVVVGGVGIVGIAVGAVFGAQAFSKWSTAKNDCTTQGFCGSGTPADSAKSSAQSAATLSTVAFAVGGAAVVGGAILWFTAPSGAVQVGPTVGGFSMRGTF